MDKQIVDKLIKFGLITNIGVDAEKYKDIDDLIAKGIITIPGAKDKINELLGDMVDEIPETIEPIEDENDDNTLVLNPEPEPQYINEVINEVLDDKSPVIDETPESEPVIDETPESDEPIVDAPAEESDIVVEESTEAVVEEVTKKTRKSKKTE